MSEESQEPAVAVAAAAAANVNGDLLGTAEDLKYAAQLLKGEKVYAALRPPPNTADPCNSICPILPLACCPICWPFVPFMICYMRNSHISAINSLYIITDTSLYIEVYNHEPPYCSCCISDKNANKRIPMERSAIFFLFYIQIKANGLPRVLHNIHLICKPCHCGTPSGQKII